MTLPSPMDAFGFDFMQRALMAGILIAIVCTLLGVFMVLRGLALVSDGLAHISFAGVAVGLVLNLFPLGFAMLAGVVGSLGIQLMRSKGWVKSDVAIGLFLSAGLATGVAIISRGHGLNVNINSYLFGAILGVTTEELRYVFVLAVLLVIAILAFYKELVYVTFNEEGARISGLPVAAINFGTSALTGICVVLAAKIVGVLLVSALIVAPAAAGLQVARSFRTTLVASGVFGLLSVVAGLYASFAWDVAPGAAIAIVSLLLFLLAATKKALLPGPS